ncbi:MAG: diadenylate cyclase CdaA [Bacteroidales bacterium]|nr:diadenylate cyclase CdaA [Bacteroidales bacterium]
MFSFLEMRFVDLIDIVLCAYIMYAIYKLIRGTVALSIVVSIVGFMLLWFLVRALKMSMLSGIMDSFVSIGLLALIVIFQQEVRRFLVMLGTRYNLLRKYGIDKMLAEEDTDKSFVSSIVQACENMSRTKTGALIVVSRNVGLKDFIATGEELNAEFSQRVIETIFFKNTPLHDGAMIVDRHKILAAACILPVSHNMDIPKHFGLRHRSALGITEVSDALAVVVSEETGNITLFDKGVFVHVGSGVELGEHLEKIW